MSRSRLGKVVAVAAVAGSVAWVGHEVVRHHHKAERLHGQVAEFMHGVHQSHSHSGGTDNGGVGVVNDFVDFKRENSPQPADDSDSLSRLPDETTGSHGGRWGRWWRRHHEEDHEESLSDSGDEEHHGRRHRRRGCHKPAGGVAVDNDRHDWADGRPKWHHEPYEVSGGVQDSVTAVNPSPQVSVVGGEYEYAVIVQEGNKLKGYFSNSNRPAFAGELTTADSGYVNFPDDRTYAFEFDAGSRTMYWEGRNSGNVWQQSQPQQMPEQVQTLELPLVDPVYPQVPELEDNYVQEHHNGGFPQGEYNEDIGRGGSRWHHSRRFEEEEQYREVESSLTEEERAEFRRLRKEARRLHCDAARTAGAFVAGAAFVGGVAHLRRLRRERREAAGAGGSCQHSCAGGESSQAVPSVTNA